VELAFNNSTPDIFIKGKGIINIVVIIQNIKHRILDIIKGNRLGVSYDEILQRYDKKYPDKPIGETKIYEVSVKDKNGEFKKDDDGNIIKYKRNYRNGGRGYIARLLGDGLIEKNKDGSGYIAIKTEDDTKTVNNGFLDGFKQYNDLFKDVSAHIKKKETINMEKLIEMAKKKLDFNLLKQLETEVSL